MKGLRAGLASQRHLVSYHQAQKQDDWIQFVEAMEKEVEDHEGRGHWILVEVMEPVYLLCSQYYPGD